MSVIPVVSSRRGYFSSDAVSKNDRVRLVDLTNPTPRNTQPITRDSFLDKMSNKHVIVLVHGYNCSFPHVCKSYYRIFDLLKRSLVPHEEVVGYVWPGGDRKISYWHARNRARQLSGRVQEMLSTLAESARTVDIVAHSMGCFLSLATISKLDRGQIRNLYLMAPAVKNYKLSEGRHFSSAAGKCESVFVFKSGDDTVLRFAFPLGAGGSEALGYTGPMPFHSLINNSLVVDCSDKKDPIGHSSYSKRAEIYDFMSRNPGPFITPSVLPL